MRKLFLYLFILAAAKLQAQNVGINTTAPQAMLHVKDSSVLFSGPSPFVNYDPASLPPAQGAGTRLMWYPAKGAFRAGWVEDNRWDKDSIGIFSIAMGHSSLASYTGSVALGIRTQSRNFASTALGYNTQATGEYSFAAGYESKATQQIAVAIGAQNTASGFFSTAIGSNNTASNTSAVAIGQSNMARGVESVAIGSNLKAKARASFVTGWYNDTSDFPDPLFVAPTDRLFQIGNGNGFLGTYSNALTVLRNGNHGLGTVNPLARLHVADSSVLFTGPSFLSGAPYPNPPVSGPGSRTMWYPSKAAFRTGLVFGTQWDNDSIGLYSFATGLNTVARGDFAFALGNNNRAIGGFSFAGGSQSRATDRAAFAFGEQAEATGYQSVALGTSAKATGFNAVSIGSNTTAIGIGAASLGYFATAPGTTAYSIGSNTVASGSPSVAIGINAKAQFDNSMSIGYNTEASGGNSIVMGFYNDMTTAGKLFEIGNGTSSLRTNALTILQNGNTGIGVVNPSFKLEVGGRMLLRNGGSSAQSAGIWLNNTANSSAPAFVGMANDNNLVGFYGSTGGWGLTMNTNNGYVGIGLNTSVPQVPLQFSNTLGLTKISLYKGTYGDVGIGAYGGELRLQNDIPNGKISMGVLETTGSFTELAKAERSGAFAFSIFGNLWVNGTTYASDERFKQNITPIGSPLQKLLQLNGVEYEMKAGEYHKNNFQTGRQMGLLAQNVEKVAPEAVNEKDGYKGVDYARLVPLLIESIKAQQVQINALQQELLDLRQQKTKQ
jgi:Chaperone of endosialidase/Head domain of trimeric autotransporter adhesin